MDNQFWGIEWVVTVARIGWKSRSFDDEVKRWIDEEWLVEWKEAVEDMIPLMAIVQPKGKVSLLEYHELNDFVDCHIEIYVCDEILWKWSRLCGGLKMIDLRCIYLQIHADESLNLTSLCCTRIGPIGSRGSNLVSIAHQGFWENSWQETRGFIEELITIYHSNIS